MSIIWDKFHLRDQRKAKETAVETSENVTLTEDRRVLEPPIFEKPNFDDTLRDVIKDVNRSHSEASDDEISNSLDQEASIHGRPEHSGEHVDD